MMNPFSKYLPALETAMRRVVASVEEDVVQPPPLLYGMLHYHLGWADAALRPAQINAGKRLRPVFLLLCCEAQGGPWQSALPAAAAVELLHNFTLIHDDIEDRDRRRRGRATLWTLWGDAQAINAGDALYTLAYRALLQLDTADLPPARVLRAVRCYTDRILKITEGQCWDIAFEDAVDIDETAYLNMIRGKTAALLGMACELGAIIAGVSDERGQALRAFGESVGMAFQIEDDVLGLWGDPARTGKPVGADFRRRKKTLPILHGLARSPALKALLAQATLEDVDVQEALALLETVGSKAYAQAQAQTHHAQALKALEASKGTGAAQHALLELAQKLLNRDK